MRKKSSFDQTLEVIIVLYSIPTCTDEMMLNHNPPSMDEDETSVPVGTSVLPPTTMTAGRRSSKPVTRTTGRSFGRMMARVEASLLLLLLLLVVEGAIVLPEEEKKGEL